MKDTKSMICEHEKTCSFKANCFHGKKHIVQLCDLWNCLQGDCVQVVGKCKCIEVKK